jgi:hypothetical protein
MLAATLTAFSMLMASALTAEAQVANPGSIEIEEGGQLWIEGSASVVNYKCRAEKLSGNGTIENTSEPEQNVTGDGSVYVQVSIPVQSLNCGKKAMNKDMYEALKAEKHEAIYYRLLSGSLKDSIGISEEDALQEEWMQIRTRGLLEIAGVADTAIVDVRGKLLDEDQFRVRGRKKINMDTYNIKPPTALMGLIKASNELTVHFDVTVKLKSK